MLPVYRLMCNIQWSSRPVLESLLEAFVRWHVAPHVVHEFSDGTSL